MSDFGMSAPNFIFALCLGLGLSAACGFRIFIPPFAMSLAAMGGVLELAPNWQWLGSPAAVLTLGVAAILEVLAYFIPWVSNGLDSVELMAAPIAGMMVTASSLSMAGDMNPIMLWATAAIFGGGTAEVVEGATALTRLATASATGGLANPVLGLIELLSSSVLSLLAILVPMLAVLIAVGLLVYAVYRIRRYRQRRQRSQSFPRE
jgi:hypothetical protein